MTQTNATPYIERPAVILNKTSNMCVRSRGTHCSGATFTTGNLPGMGLDCNYRGRAAIRHGGIGIISRNSNTNCHSELKQAIRERIGRTSGVRVYNLEVEIEGDSVVLSGRCSTFYTKQLVQHAALDVMESRQLENRIQVHAGDNLLTDQRSQK